jgi:hypothetical protein
VDDLKNQLKKPTDLKSGHFYRLYEEGGGSRLILVTTTAHHKNGKKRQADLVFDYVDMEMPQRKVVTAACTDVGLVPYDDQSFSKSFLVSCPALAPADNTTIRLYKK